MMWRTEQLWFQWFHAYTHFRRFEGIVLAALAGSPDCTDEQRRRREQRCSCGSAAAALLGARVGRASGCPRRCRVAKETA